MKKIRTGYISRTSDDTYILSYRINGGERVYHREFWYKKEAVIFLHGKGYYEKTQTPKAV